MVCSGCDHAQPAEEFLTFACPNAGTGDTDHVLRAKIPSKQLQDAWPSDAWTLGDNPFVRYRRLSHTYRLAMRSGMSDEEYLDTALGLSTAVEVIDSTGPRITPWVVCDTLDVTIKNETINVAGSHKARHLIGTALHLEVAKRLGKGVDSAPTLAIASCGNAALAAAVVARAARCKLRVFVPPWADSKVLARLTALDAEQVICERRASDSAGDPCYLRFREAVVAGALPFSCQGGDNALALLGGHNLAWELIDQSSADPVQHLFIQVGGGALASSVMQAYSMAKEAGIIGDLPRFHAVQTDNAHPLARAWRALRSSGADLSEARHHRSQYMWPWESQPKSIASGILDDETYDWFSIVEGLSKSGGSVVTVSETRLSEAQRLGQAHTGIAVDATGTAGLAGLLEVRSRGKVPNGETCAVLFTGAIR